MESTVINIPIPDRDDMALFAERFFKKTGYAAEIGVFEGAFSAHNLKVWSGTYVMIDAWSHRPGDGKDKNDVDSGIWYERMERAIRATGFADSRRRVFKGLSVEMASGFPDWHFDWIYIDAGHDYKNCYSDLEAWWPKLRPGGLFSGDDYGLGDPSGNLLPLTIERFASVWRSASDAALAHKWGTADALHDFCFSKRAHLNITWLNDRNNPAWYIIKE